MLLPHFGRAMKLQLRLRAAAVEASSATDALDRLPQAMFLVDARGGIAFANRAAEALLARADGVRANAAGLCAATAAQTASLRRLIGRAVGAVGALRSGGSMRLDRPSGRRALSVMVTPLRAGAQPEWVPGSLPAAVVLVADPDAEAATVAPGQLRALYGLTPAEAALAARVASGGGVKAAARALGIAPSTARTHLHRVFDKTGTARQAELAALLATLRGIVAG